MQPNINRNTQAWANEMRKNGYTNLMFYTSASWLDENKLRKKGPSQHCSIWSQNSGAQYPSPKLSVNDAKSLRYNGSWRLAVHFSSGIASRKTPLDHSVDYTGRFQRTQNLQWIQQKAA